MHTIHDGVLYWINATPTCFGGQATIVRGVSYATVAICIETMSYFICDQSLKFFIVSIWPLSTIFETAHTTTKIVLSELKYMIKKNLRLWLRMK
jgi:hypothetical protein